MSILVTVAVYDVNSAWLQRVNLDLSELHDSGIIDTEYFHEAWTCLHIIALAQTKQFRPETKLSVARELLADLRLQKGTLGREDWRDEELENLFDSPREDDEEEGQVGHDEQGRLDFTPSSSIAGRRWRFYQADADSNRPAPHGHDSNDHRIVFDPYTGVVTGPNGEQLKKAKLGELERLWRCKKFRAFAYRAREWMKSTQPWRTDALPPLPPYAKD